MGSQASYSTMRYEDKDYSDMRSGSYNLGVRSDLSQYLSETTGFVDLAQRRYDYEGSQVSDYTTVTIGLEKKTERTIQHSGLGRAVAHRDGL